MSQQPSLFPEGTSPVPPSPPPSGQRPGAVPAWLQYLELSVRVVVRLSLGLIVFVLPWTHFGGDNRLLLLFPHLLFAELTGATRGIVTGLRHAYMRIGGQD